MSSCQESSSLSARWSALVPRPVPVVRTLRRRTRRSRASPVLDRVATRPWRAPSDRFPSRRLAAAIRPPPTEPRNNSQVKLPVTEPERVDFSRGPDRVKRFLGEWRYPAEVAREFRGRVRQSRRAILTSPCVAQGAPAWDCTNSPGPCHRTPIRHATAGPISEGSHTSRTAVRVAVRGR